MPTYETYDKPGEPGTGVPARQAPFVFAGMTRREGIWALALLVVHIFLFPVALSLLQLSNTFALQDPSATLYVNIGWMVVVLVVLCLVFRDYFRRSFAALRANKGRWVSAYFGGLGIGYGGNILASLLLLALGTSFLQSQTLQDQVTLTTTSLPMMSVLAVLLAPTIEETLVRGGIFSQLYPKSKWAAWVLSVLFFAFIHVAQQALTSGAFQLIYILQFIPLSCALAFAYQRSGSVVVPIAVHTTINLIAVSAQYLLLPLLQNAMQQLPAMLP